MMGGGLGQVGHLYSFRAIDGHGRSTPTSTTAGDELRAIRRYLATREDNLPWLFVSEWQAQPTRQAVNYIVRVVGETAKLGQPEP